MFLLTFADSSSAIPSDLSGQKALLRKRFAHTAWEGPQILEALDSVDELYFDRVSQIQMDPRPGSWSRGRVTLLGDAASCVSLLAGQGSALAMVSAYILAAELQRAAGDYALAFSRYQELFGPFVRRKQDGARRLGSTFAPGSRSSLVLRNLIMNLMRFPGIASLALGRDLADRITLPQS